LAGSLLNVGRPSKVAAEGDELGEGGVMAGEGVGVVIGGGVPAGVADGVVAGVGVLARDDIGVALDGGVGELADWPPDASGDFCSQAGTRELVNVMATIKSLFTPINTDA
jgi:hypothetical protein